MKRTNNLFDTIYDSKNLELAFYKAAKGKRHKKEVQDFAKSVEFNLQKLSFQIQQNSLSNSYRYFKVYDPKERVISVAPFSNRVIHHAIVNVCHNTFENHQIYHSYATRLGKGTHKAIQQVVCNNKKNNWFLKLDVKKFFDTINHKVLISLLEKKFKEPQLLHLFKNIITSFNTNKGIGLPIGNLTSQYFANFYLAFLDRYAKQHLHIKHYIRYMDDIVLWGNSKAQIWYYYNKLKLYLENNLKQTFKKPIFNKTTFSFNYLGYTITKDKIKPNKRNRNKYAKKTQTIQKHLKNNLITEKKAATQFWAMYNHQQFKINNYAL